MELYFLRILGRPSIKVCKAKVLQEKKTVSNKSHMQEKTVIRRQSINLLATTQGDKKWVFLIRNCFKIELPKMDYF